MRRCGITGVACTVIQNVNNYRAALFTKVTGSILVTFTTTTKGCITKWAIRASRQRVGWGRVMRLMRLHCIKSNDIRTMLGMVGTEDGNIGRLTISIYKNRRVEQFQAWAAAGESFCRDRQSQAQYNEKILDHSRRHRLYTQLVYEGADDLFRPHHFHLEQL